MFNRRVITFACLGASLLFSSPEDANAGIFRKLSRTFQTKKEAKKPTIKVMLKSDAVDALLEVTGGYNIYDPYKGKRIGTAFSGKSRVISAGRTGLSWGEEFPGVYQLSFVPDDGEKTFILEGREYSGILNVYQVEGNLFVINEVTLEDYVRSTIASRVENTYESETLAAMAIIARTEAYYYSKLNEDKYWHVNSGDVNYQGPFVISERSEIAEAIEKTEGMILSEKDPRFNLKPFLPSWTENSAGKTIAYSAVYGNRYHGAKKGISFPINKTAREQSAWSHEMSSYDLARLVGFETLDNIQVVRDTASSKVVSLSLESGRERKIVAFVDMQELIGASHLESNDFNLKVEEGVLHFEGVGKGHGVGLCLFSSDMMASRGANAAKILTTFFPDAELKKEGAAREKQR